MPNTTNHEYNVPNQGAQDWHVPLNENFEDYDTDIELRDTDSNKSNYDPKQGAKFLATDTGIVYTGDGSDWVPTTTQYRYTPSDRSDYAGNLVAGHPNNSIANGIDAATIAGGGTKHSPNEVGDHMGTVSGGMGNKALGPRSTIAGGNKIECTAELTTAGGGFSHEVSGRAATVAGGQDHEASGSVSTVGGGVWNVASGRSGTVSGGDNNVASSEGATVGGGSYNNVAGAYATIAGGGPSDTTNSQSTRNAVYDQYGTVGGGGNNQAGTDDGDSRNAMYATVSGGEGNEATADHATVAGGDGNTATAKGATVSGGEGNDATQQNAIAAGGKYNEATGYRAAVVGGSGSTASGNNAAVVGGNGNQAEQPNTLAAGQRATAAHSNTFVWADGTTANGSHFSSASDPNNTGVVGQKTFHVRASNGVRFVTSSATTYLDGSGGGWANTSTRTAKTNISPVEPSSALEGVDSMEIATWEYEDEDGEGAGTTHIGPMAEEFHEAFDVGSSDEHINSINADGVALAAIQGLSEKVDERDDQIEDLESTVADQHDEIETLRAEIEELRTAVES